MFVDWLKPLVHEDLVRRGVIHTLQEIVVLAGHALLDQYGVDAADHARSVVAANLTGDDLEDTQNVVDMMSRKDDDAQQKEEARRVHGTNSFGDHFDNRTTEGHGFSMLASVTALQVGAGGCPDLIISDTDSAYGYGVLPGGTRAMGNVRHRTELKKYADPCVKLALFWGVKKRSAACVFHGTCREPIQLYPRGPNNKGETVDTYVAAGQCFLCHSW